MIVLGVDAATEMVSVAVVDGTDVLERVRPAANDGTPKTSRR